MLDNYRAGVNWSAAALLSSLSSQNNLSISFHVSSKFTSGMLKSYNLRSRMISESNVAAMCAAEVERRI